MPCCGISPAANPVRRDLVLLLAKDKNLPEDKLKVFGYRSVWTWTALDADLRSRDAS